MLFHRETRAVVHGVQVVAVQRMLDFDHVCGRSRPSVAAIVQPTANDGLIKLSWGSEEVLVPLYPSLSHALADHPDVDVLVNLASARSAAAVTREAFGYPAVRTVAVIAEGVPERDARLLAAEARAHGVTLIGPATVGAVKPGCFRVGSSGGAMDNVLAARLYRPGSVAYVSRSGGLSNELNQLLGRVTDGVYEGVAIGGDRFPGSTFLDHLLRWEADEAVAMTVLLGEVGGALELDVRDALADGRLTKPLVAWCLGTSAPVFPTEAQFGHAGALATSADEAAAGKNAALAAAGALVPAGFEDLVPLVAATYDRLVAAGRVVPRAEPDRPSPAMDYAWAAKLGIVRRPSNFICTISDDRGAEPTYAGTPISTVARDLGVGGAVGLLWLRRALDADVRAFLELLLIVVASRDPAVAGTRATTLGIAAGKDLVSAVCAGLLMIGPRFGGAVDAAASAYAAAVDAGVTPEAFVEAYETRASRIPGVGYPTDDRTDTAARVDVVVSAARRLLPATPVLDHALAVGRVTEERNARLLVNVDGVVGAALADLLREGSGLSPAEAADHLRLGVAQGLFLLGRLVDFVGHAVDLGRLASVGFVTTGDVLSPELGDVVARNADGVRDALAVGGVRYPGADAVDHLLRLERDARVSMSVLVDDGTVPVCTVCDAVADGRLRKPLVVWTGAGCPRGLPGGCALRHDRRLGDPHGAVRHVGAAADPHAALGEAINQTYRRLAAEGVVAGLPDGDVEAGPPADALYAGVPLHRVVDEGLGLGGVLGLLWFRRVLPDYAARFLEMTIAIVADHGPAVSGAHSTIVASRAGKDLVASVVSGLLTVGPRFGGAIDEAARAFGRAVDEGISPERFVDETKRRGQLVMGIGHRVRSLEDPDPRVSTLRQYAEDRFPSTEVLGFALAVERITTRKRGNLILNVDGCIAACVVDLLRSCGAFGREEADAYVELGFLNGLFLLGRSIGLVGHHLDQRRLRQGLYRHPWDDIAYMGGSAAGLRTP